METRLDSLDGVSEQVFPIAWRGADLRRRTALEDGRDHRCPYGAWALAGLER